MIDSNFIWGLDKENPMIICVYKSRADYTAGRSAMRIFLGEAIELAGRKRVMQHISDCDSTPWLKDWQFEKKEAEADRIVDRLSGNL